MSDELLKAITVTAEAMGRELSVDALDLFERDLSPYPLLMVLKALERTRLEVRHGLTIADVIMRLDDGRPKAEEAWAMIPTNEADSVVWTKEMVTAYAAASPLIDRDKVAARLAFKEVYERELLRARAEKVPVKWVVSLGHDPRGREDALRKAVEVGRITADHAQMLLPAPLLQLPANVAKRLTDETNRRSVEE